MSSDDEKDPPLEEVKHEKAATSTNTNPPINIQQSYTHQNHSQRSYPMMINIPKFYKPDPEMYFLNIESQFTLAGINDDQIMFVQLTAKMEPEILAEVSDILKNPDTRSYQHVKAAIIKRFGQSEEERLNKLLGTMDLGDRQPSQLLREIQRLAPGVPTNIIRGIWLKKLPSHVQQILQAVITNDLSQQAEVADRVTSVHTPVIAAVAPVPVTSTSPSTLETAVAQLSNKLMELTTRINEMESKHRSRSSHSRASSRSKSSPKPLCRIHFKYGEQARHCLSPNTCTFQTKQGKD